MATGGDVEEPRDIGQSSCEATTRRGSRSDRSKRKRKILSKRCGYKRGQRRGAAVCQEVAAAPVWEGAEGSGRAVMWSWASTRGQGLGAAGEQPCEGVWKFPSACISSAGKARSEIRGRQRREGPGLTVPRYEGTTQAGGRSRRPEWAWSCGLGLTTWDPLARQQGTWSGKPWGSRCEGAA